MIGARLFKGDCIPIMQKLISQSVKVNMIAADLPYGTTRNKWDVIIPFDELWDCYKRILTHNGVIVLTACQPFTSQLIMSNPGWFKFTMVWRKNLKTGNLNARKRPMVGFEDIVVFYNNTPTYNPQKIPRTFQKKSGNKLNSRTTNYGKQKKEYTDRQSDWLMPDNVIDFEDGFFHVDTLKEMESGAAPMLHFECVHNSQGKVHPTQKPVALFEWLIKTFSNEGDWVLDNTMGVATTGCSALPLDRNFIGIENDVDYFHVGLNRMKNSCGNNLFSQEELVTSQLSQIEWCITKEKS